MAGLFALLAAAGVCLPEVIGWFRIDGFVNLGANHAFARLEFLSANVTLRALLGLTILLRAAAYLLLTFIIFKFTAAFRQG